MTTNLALAAIHSSSFPSPGRTLGDRFADVVNVKDFGAKGDGVTNDTSAIQAAFDYAFGTWASPHLNTAANPPVFFPAGTYLVSPPGGASALTITSCVNNGSGVARLGFGSAHGLTTGDNVYIRGVTGTTFANGPSWVTVIDSTHVDLLAGGGSFNATWTGGGTVCIPCLRIKGANGSIIYGAGRGTTTIQSNTAKCTVLHINGWRYGHFQDISFNAGAGGVAVDLNWDDIVNQSTQGNCFEHCAFGDGNADIGLALGYNGAMTSENTIVSCQFSADIGVYIGNYNSTNNAMFGGQCQACRIGIYGSGGDMCTIYGVSFENTQGGQFADIAIGNSAGSGYSIHSCRSESANFISCGPPVSIHISCCSQMGGTGAFFYGSGIVTMTGCYSPNGYIGGNPSLIMQNCVFGSPDFLTRSGPNYTYLEQTPKPVTTQTAATYSFSMSDIGAKVRFNRSTSQTVTIPAWQYIGYNYPSIGNISVVATGVKIEVQQIGVGQTIFQGSAGVTIRSSNGLKLRAQYSTAVLTCDSNDGAGNIVWTLSGDTTT